MNLFSPYNYLIESSMTLREMFVEVGQKAIVSHLENKLASLKPQITTGGTAQEEWIYIQIWRFQVAGIIYYKQTNEIEANIMGKEVGDTTIDDFIEQIIISQKGGNR